MRPHPWQPKNIPTLWVSLKAGFGLTDDGQRVTVHARGGRKVPNLTDLLDCALTAGVGRVMLTSAPEAREGVRHWLLVGTPGWRSSGHWLGTPPTGRFSHRKTGEYIEVRTCREWFGTDDLTPEAARLAWQYTARAVAIADDRARLFKSPAGTGTNLWALSLPRSIDPEPVAEDIAEELHYTSGQHHLEHCVAGESACECEDCVPMIDPAATPRIGTFAYIDGRFMYASLCRELGTGPGVRLNRAQAWDLLQADQYARARFLVKFTVPNDWQHIGLFGVKYGELGWHWPNRPGMQAETWADAAEVHNALTAGWAVEPLEGVAFHKCRVLDTWAERLVRVRARVAGATMDPTIQQAVLAALRAILLQAIGAFASRGRDETVVVESARDVPAQYQSSIVRYGEVWAYRIPKALTGRALEYYRPELAAQVWGRGRARVMMAPAANRTRAGALTLPGSSIIGINGDAIYATEVPAWSLPQERGGGDDGAVGRLRLQGVVTGRLVTPASLTARDRLRKRAERAGLSGLDAGSGSE